MGLYNTDNYGGMLLGVAFTAAGIYILSNQFILKKNHLTKNSFDNFVNKISPLRKSFPIFSTLWVVLLGVSTFGLGIITLVDNLIYSNTHVRQSDGFVIFWIPYAFCLGTAGLFASKDSFRTKNPVGIVFTRIIASVFVGVSLFFGYSILTHFDQALFLASATSYFSDIQHFLKTGTPLN